jgi:ribose-phosphate pyrophosphokinase
MITVNGYKIEPTRFPDGTTQVWRLPEEILKADHVLVDWRFEHEAEFFTLMQLRALLHEKKMSLHVPYLPFARQDKDVSNTATFALHPFGDMINWLRCEEVTAVDVHNEDTTHLLITNFRNIPVEMIHDDLIRVVKPDLIVFPDAGAVTRYAYLRKHPYIVFEKDRDQATGEIRGHVLTKAGNPELIAHSKKLLIIDDLCDGGATFLSVAKAVNAKFKDMQFHLFVTHGLFSKGRKLLEDAGFTLYTTDSLPRNNYGIRV